MSLTSDTHDFRLKHPHACLVFGPSQSGEPT